MDDLGEEFTIKFVNDFCNVKRSVAGDTTPRRKAFRDVIPVPVVGCNKVAYKD